MGELGASGASSRQGIVAGLCLVGGLCLTPPSGPPIVPAPRLPASRVEFLLVTQIPVPKTVVVTNRLRFAPDRLVLAAGPCAVESREQLSGIAGAVAVAGANMLRGGAFKPRTSPSSFQGLGVEGLRLLREASEATGLPVVTEVLDPSDVGLVGEYADMLQIGARSMQNIPLLREVGRLGRPVLLKRGAAATIEELLGAAEYIRCEGNEDVVLCERGLRSFDPSTRFLLDLSAVPVLKSLTDLPVMVDPSHATGHAHLVAPMACAAVAAGADGLLIEVHSNPDQALSDRAQALRPEEFSDLVTKIRGLLPMLHRSLSPAETACTLEVQASAR